MATEINDADKVQLLFKQFTGVVNAKQQDPFPVESFAFKNYILNNNILSDNIPATLPSGWRSSDLDGSSNIANDSVTNLASIGYPQLSFHKKRDLSGATFGSLKTWFIDDGSGGSALKNAISFKNDPISNSYNYSVYQKINSSVFSPVNMYTNPTFWLFDFKSGFLEFYGDEDDLNGANIGSGGIDLTTWPPVISFFQYVGATGGGGGGGGGDASYNNIDVSGNIVLQGNNLMQSVTIQPWSEPDPQPPNMTYNINYVIATVDISGNSEMPLGYFTLQLGNPYKQVISFYAGVIENKGAFIKIISCTNEDTFNKYGFKNLKIISYDGTCYLVSTFWTAVVGGGDPDLLKIILVNNNANRDDNPTNNPDWILRNNPDEDWLSDGPLPPETKMPWTVGSPSYPVPTLPPALVTVSLLQNGGMPYGVSTQPEYFQNNIVLDTSANILAGENGTGTVDICGGLYVDRDASFNMDVHVRSSVDISGALTVDSSGTFGGDLFAANTPMIEYIRYDNNNFNSNTTSPSITGSWQTIAQIYPISPLSAQVDTRAAYAIFEIVDRSNNNTNYNFQDNITCMISYTTGECTLNVLSSNPTGNTSGGSQIGYIGNIRLQCGKHSLGGGSLLSANLQIKRFCDDTGTGTTDVRVRMYHNFQPMLMPREFTPFVLTSTSLSLITGTITNTEFDVLNYASGFKSSTTKRHYIDKSTIVDLVMAGDINMASNNIVNANIISKGSSSALPRIELDASGINLLLDDNTTNHKITLGDDNTPSNQIYMRVNPDVTLDMNYVEISKVNKITSDQTIDICANNIIIRPQLTVTDLSATNIDISNNLNVAGLITGEADTTFVEYRDFSIDIPANGGDTWHCIATTIILPDVSGRKQARGLFIIDDDTSGIREQIIFYAGTSYARGNFVNVLAHNWYINSGPLISKIKIDVSGSQPTPTGQAVFAGSNLYIYRKNSSSISDIHIRLYENGRDPSTGGRWVLTSTPIANLNTTAVNLDISYDPTNQRANSASSLDYSFQGDVSFDGDVSMNKLNLNILEVEKPNGDDVLKVDGTNNTATLSIPLNLYRDTLSNIDSGSTPLTDYSIGIVNNVGNSISSGTTYQTDAIAWKPRVSGSSSDVRLMVNEQTVHIYNRQLTGSITYGGIDPATSSSQTSGGFDYKRYTLAGGATRISYFGCMPTSNDGSSSSRPISSKLHFMRKTWITGVYLNSPFNGISTAVDGAIFLWGTNSYVELEIGAAGSQFVSVYRIGNPTSGPVDSYGFPASPGYNSSTGGIRVSLTADNWIYIPEGTNMSQVVRFKYYVNSQIDVIDESNGTNYHESQIDGYVTYIQQPIANII